MSIYEDPVAYSKLVRMPISLSKIWCERQLELSKLMDEARICPKCGKETLVLEGGSYEEGTRDYVYCENDEIQTVDEENEVYFEECDYFCEPQKQHEPLSSWYDFDVILAFSSGIDMWKQEFGTLQEWLKFVRKEVDEIRPKVTA